MCRAATPCSKCNHPFSNLSIGQELVQQGLQAGAEGFFVKPLTRDNVSQFRDHIWRRSRGKRTHEEDDGGRPPQHLSRTGGPSDSSGNSSGRSDNRPSDPTGGAGGPGGPRTRSEPGQGPRPPDRGGGLPSCSQDGDTELLLALANAAEVDAGAAGTGGRMLRSASKKPPPSRDSAVAAAADDGGGSAAGPGQLLVARVGHPHPTADTWPPFPSGHVSGPGSQERPKPPGNRKHIINPVGSLFTHSGSSAFTAFSAGECCLKQQRSFVHAAHRPIGGQPHGPAWNEYLLCSAGPSPLRPGTTANSGSSRSAPNSPQVPLLPEGLAVAGLSGQPPALVIQPPRLRLGSSPAPPDSEEVWIESFRDAVRLFFPSGGKSSGSPLPLPPWQLCNRSEMPMQGLHQTDSRTRRRRRKPWRRSRPSASSAWLAGLGNTSSICRRS